MRKGLDIGSVAKNGQNPSLLIEPHCDSFLQMYFFLSKLNE